ncbi:uncharacterized protein LOC120415474 isoform X1 [Culex pipiens pallens]|uniref:uncharacterized protein LOC120415474 isoform X1 n=1 Tax=Culex pipiens pallens TaxID=42434 RepID=UPI001952DC0D|nr:uncharacterized protein LOC120415474 isoform X1 [Culex pipiens pallens]
MEDGSLDESSCLFDSFRFPLYIKNLLIVFRAHPNNIPSVLQLLVSFNLASISTEDDTTVVQYKHFNELGPFLASFQSNQTSSGTRRSKKSTNPSANQNRSRRSTSTKVLHLVRIIHPWIPTSSLAGRSHQAWRRRTLKELMFKAMFLLLNRQDSTPLLPLPC